MRPITRMQGLAWFALFVMVVFTLTDIEARGGGVRERGEGAEAAARGGAAAEESRGVG